MCPTPSWRSSEVARAASGAIAAAGGGEPACAYYSLSGADWPVDIAYYSSELARRRAGRAHGGRERRDRRNPLRARRRRRLLARVRHGHGARVRALRDGRIWHMSFQAAPTFTTDLTRATLDAAVRSELGLLPPSSLSARVAAAFGAADAIGAIERVTGRGPRPPRVSLGGLLLDCASEGDELALDRVSWVAGEAAAYLRVAARESGLGEPTPIALAGGVMRHPSSLLVDALAAALPGCELVRARREPAHAALLAALDEGGASPVALDDSLLPADLFATSF